MLQAYGLSQAIARLGHEVQVIDYRPAAVRAYREGPLPRNPRKLFREALRRWRIRDFRSAYLPLTRPYLTLEELRADPPQADVVVCGSDQVWNTTSPVRGFDPAFFLDFLPEHGPRRVSYAATFGAGLELGPHKLQIGSMLARFDHISLRDAPSQALLHELIGRDSTHVLDPSFLTDYGSITPPPLFKQPYILAYCFRKTALARQAIEALQRHCQLPVISIKTNFAGAQTVYPGPLQWLSLMRHAQFVCTDSFHGTCFSLINRKPFVTLPYEGGMTRLEDLLQTAGLPERLVRQGAELACAIERPIAYEMVGPRLEEARKRSLTFLQDALSSTQLEARQIA